MKEVSPTPLSRTFAQKWKNRVVSTRIDGRCEDGCRVQGAECRVQSAKCRVIKRLVGATIGRPPFVRDNRSFFGRSKPLPYRLIVYSVVFVTHRGSSRTSTPTRNFIIRRRGDSRIARLLCAIRVCFLREAKRLPYTESYNSALCTLHSALFTSSALLQK